MKSTLEIELGKMRKIMLGSILKTKRYIAVYVLAAIDSVYFIFNLTIGYKTKNMAMLASAWAALIAFIICFLAITIALYRFLYVKIKGKNNMKVTFEYEFKPEIVLVKSMRNNNVFVLNKSNIKKYYIIDNILVVEAIFLFILPFNEQTMNELNLENI